LLSRGASDAISRIVNDTGVLGNGLGILLSKAVLQIAKGVVGLVVAVVFDWRVTLVALLIAPLLYHVIRRLGKRIKRASNATLQSQSGLYMTASESITALRVVKVHAAERYEAARFHRMNKEMLREQNRLRTAKALASPLTEALTVLMLCGMVLLLGRGILRGEVQPAGFVLAIASLAVAGASLKPLTGIINDIQSSAPAAERLMDLLQLEPEAGHPTPQARRPPKLNRHAREIAFENVAITYEGATRPALAGVTLIVPFGRRVAIVGGNGSGKTTLLALLPRLFDPDSGRVLVDGTDIRHVSVRSLREQIGVVTQEVTLFRGTIRSNIVYNAGNVGHDEVVAAARLARAHEFITAMPQGYDTPVTEQGLNLSGGQRQRISIARAILRNPSILIMDEATSMIDAESEIHIGQAIKEFGVGRTCLIVAHRKATILSCDHIFVLDSGVLADHGSHDELLQRCDAYRALWRGRTENG
jgi:ABC-type multidrug transport system fused ATPase/permease subunit